MIPSAEPFTTAANRTQEAAASALRSWVDSLRNFAGGQSPLPNLPGMVARYFDTMQQILDTQRQFAETVLQAALTTQAGVSQTARVAEQTADHTHTEANNAAVAVTRAAKE